MGAALQQLGSFQHSEPVVILGDQTNRLFVDAGKSNLECACEGTIIREAVECVRQEHFTKIVKMRCFRQMVQRKHSWTHSGEHAAWW